MTKMSSLNYMELCRLCLVKEKVSVPIFEGEGGERQIFDKIATCLPVKVSQDDKLPKKICSDCVYRVENSYQFWNTTSNSEKQLLEWVVNDVKVDSKNLVSDNITMETEQLVLKEEAIDHDQTAADVAKSLSRVEAVLTEETGQPGGVSEEEEEEEDSDDGGGGGGGEDSNSEESGEEPPGKEEIESEEEEEEEEPYEELEPTTFVNVSLACDEAGPSGIQQTRQQTKQDNQTSAASASATTANAEAPSTSAADPAASGSSLDAHKNVKTVMKLRSSSSSKFKNEPCNQSLAPLVSSASLVNTKTSSDLVKPLEKLSPRPLKGTKNNFTETVCCETCDKTFASKHLLIRHRIAHGDTYPHPCPVCSQKFKTVEHLKKHMECHLGEKKFKCDMCDSTFSRQSYCKLHRMRHLKAFTLHCKHCGKGFHTRTELQGHVNVHHGGNMFVCHVCKRVYPHRYVLECHLRMHEPGYELKKRHQCETCGKTFTYKNSLNLHSKRHAGHTFVCDVCGKCMTSRWSLVNHLRIHSGEKPLVCDVCGKSFTKSTGLKVHRRTHTGERPYSCDLCGKSFTQCSTMVIHKRYHSGLRPFECAECGRSFVSGTLLNSHAKIHTPDSRHSC